MTAKELAKLAKACRAAGIRHYKTPEFEFTLTEQAPPAKQSSRQTQDFTDTTIEAEDTWESLSEEEKLFYSVNPGALEESSEGN